MSPAAQDAAPFPKSPFAWGLSQRLAVVTALLALLWLVVAWALDWLAGL
ncbi:hypothetical protein [Candidatus Magnetaquicoccus inordinatus]|nr:hypothetical protein [Candidatus Magnetaquicoccus inordinatus]